MPKDNQVGGLETQFVASGVITLGFLRGLPLPHADVNNGTGPQIREQIFQTPSS